MSIMQKTRIFLKNIIIAKAPCMYLFLKTIN